MLRGLALAALATLLAGCPPEPSAEPEPDPTPAPDPCADIPVGDTEACPAASCADRPAVTGELWLGDERPVLAACEEGWLLVELDDADGVIVAENDAGNPWHKCDDDAAAPYQHIASEDVVVPDWSAGNVEWHVDLGWRRPGAEAAYTREQLDVLRAPLTELAPTTRMIATTGDDDNGSWQDGDGGGHEVYVVRDDGVWMLLSPGTNGECGGASGWPTPGSRTATYVWASDAADSLVYGDTGSEPIRPAAVPPEALLPVEAVLVVSTGGGVSFGFEERVVHLR